MAVDTAKKRRAAASAFNVFMVVGVTPTSDGIDENEERAMVAWQYWEPASDWVESTSSDWVRRRRRGRARLTRG